MTQNSSLPTTRILDLEIVLHPMSSGRRTLFPYPLLYLEFSRFIRQGWRLPTLREARLVAELASLGVGDFPRCPGDDCHGGAGSYWTSEAVPNPGGKKERKWCLSLQPEGYDVYPLNTDWSSGVILVRSLS